MVARKLTTILVKILLYRDGHDFIRTFRVVAVASWPSNTGMCYWLASDHQVASINHPDSLGALGQLDRPLTLLLALYDAVQAHSPSRGIDINSCRH